MVSNKRRILVTGGAGYLGSVLTGKLLMKGYKVRILDELWHGDIGITRYLNNPHFELMKGNMRDLQVAQAAVKDVETVIHLAAIVGDPACSLIHDATIGLNYLATSLLAQCGKYYGVQRFIFASTCSVYGFGDMVFTEESKLNPVSLYARSKIQAEEALLEIASDTFRPIILRKSTVYGLSPRMRFDLVVNLLVAKAVLEKQIPIFGGSQWRPFLHVSDAAEAYMACIEAPIDLVGGQTFNVGDNNQNFQLIGVGRIVKEYVPEADLICDEHDSDARSYRVDFNKIDEKLGFRSRLTVSDGVREIVEAFRKGRFTSYNEKTYNNFLQDEIEHYKNILRYDSPDKF